MAASVAIGGVLVGNALLLGHLEGIDGALRDGTEVLVVGDCAGDGLGCDVGGFGAADAVGAGLLLPGLCASEVEPAVALAEEFAQLVKRRGVKRSRPYRFRRADAYDGEV